MDGQKDSRNSQPTLNACQELRDMLPAYVIGALNADEMARIQVLFEACPDAKGELKDYAAVMVGFLERIEPVEPPESLLSNLIDAVHRERPSENEIPVVSTNGDTEP